ncbi:hypothetical protein [Ideonella sp.]|uniref:hypothetical protein n=1 Tax=Ideonella sp. TaxID=1929293 RepID=UPI0037BF0831
MLALSACGGGDDEGACTAEARVSVVLSIVDDLNAPVAAADVSYRVDGGAAQTLVCGASGACNIANEISGVFAVSASKSGYLPASGTVTVNRDACHVITQKLTLTLKRAS